MKLSIVVLTALIISVVNAVVYEEEDVYDDTEVNDKSAYEIVDEDSERPKYNLKDAPQLFLDFVRDYNKEYKTEQDYKRRYGNFVRNLGQIIENNKKGSSISNINMFTDYDDRELARLG